MKSIVLIFVSVCCLFVTIKAAAVESVVELQKDDHSQVEKELKKDDSQKPASEAKLPTNEDCIQPKETGRCFALFYRFAYDVEKSECVEFIYGGCAGNSNNFETKKDCELKCLENKHDKDDDVLNTTVSPNSETEATTVPVFFAEN